MPSTPNIGVISGTPNTGLENSAMLVPDIDPLLYVYETDKHPIISKILTNGMQWGFRDNSSIPKLTGTLNKRATKNPEFKFNEDQVELSNRGAYNPTAAVTASATSLTVSSTDDDHFRAGDVVLLTNASGQTERLYVASVATNTLNVTNPDGTTRTAGITMTTSDEFYLLENVRAEDSSAPSIRTTKRAQLSNYTEIFSEPFGLTKTKLATSDYNGDPWLLEKRKAFSRFLTKMNKAFWFGTKDVSGTSTNPIYHTGGFKHFLELYSDTEIRDMAGRATTRAEVISFLTAVGRGGSVNKVVVCGSRALEIINSFGWENVKTTTYGTSEIGMNINKIFGPFGDVELVYEPLFDDVKFARGWMAVLDLNHLQFRYLSTDKYNYDIKEEEQLLADGSTAKKSQYIGQCGFEFTTMKTMGLLKNIGA